jgi:hypothetical protein
MSKINRLPNDPAFNRYSLISGKIYEYWKNEDQHVNTHFVKYSSQKMYYMFLFFKQTEHACFISQEGYQTWCGYHFLDLSNLKTVILPYWKIDRWVTKV